ncbi:hypothetical protein QTI17_30790 [Variovorax sp. J31P179]|jgi:hypothetical protein|uniref:hypothetical protein n=1 Tax=Variovorax sp. J31P179 TaxID=3053508 RepID=UPI00257736CE|nr:hypothetical protein [Variovorax sp. J31P179]MDM0084987.1 hypothetical protein [Variovorax sp. J31P179]
MATPCEAIYCFDRAAVRFAIYPEGLEGPRILAEISEDALRDVFGARDGPDSLLKTCEANFEAIEKAAMELQRRRPEAPIELEIMDFSVPSTRQDFLSHRGSGVLPG